jgi:hypothetical protein
LERGVNQKRLIGAFETLYKQIRPPYRSGVEQAEMDDTALTIQEARNFFTPKASKQTVYRLVWSGKIKVLNQPGVVRIPASELRRFFGKVVTYRSRRRKYRLNADRLKTAA